MAEKKEDELDGWLGDLRAMERLRGVQQLLEKHQGEVAMHHTCVKPWMRAVAGGKLLRGSSFDSILYRLKPSPSPSIF